MRGIELKDSMQLMGALDGFIFWFKWSFRDPVQMWIWLNVTHKEYCTYSGFHCHKENCEYKHLSAKKDILANWAESNAEMNKIEKGKNGECAYCGKNPGEVLIQSPNMSELSQWLVCKSCKETIKLQTELTFCSITNNTARALENNDRLLEIAKETGERIIVSEITKQGVSSITYGDENE